MASSTSLLRRNLSCFWFCVCFTLVSTQFRIQPEQVHLSYGRYESELFVTWITINSTTSTTVEYGLNGSLSLRQTGLSRLFTDGGTEHRKMWIHSAVLKKLMLNECYVYHVGSIDGWSDLFSFKTAHSGSNWSPVIAVYGDMGNSNSKAMSYLQEEAQKNTVDSILHIGDFAYDMDSDNARVGDVFMNQIQSIAAYVPYMTCPGNHEQKYNFSNYKFRFNMPNSQADGLYYSYNIGPAHIISISTEVYYYGEYGILDGIHLIEKQYNWLKQDLYNANKESQRKERPWLIVVGHRPMYCSNNEGPKPQHCNNFTNNFVRTGLPDVHSYSLEDLFYKAGVDLQFYAHEHSYERLWPVYNLTVCNGSKSVYDNPPAPVHVITGSAGNNEGQTHFDKVVYPWSAFHSDDFGYTKMHLLNKTHLSLKQISIDKGGEVIDEMMLTKNKHGAGLFNCPPR